MVALDKFTPDNLLKVLRTLPPAKRFWIAYSGGCDSHVLLHMLATLRSKLHDIKLAAIHIDHGLSQDSFAWSGHCKSVCGELGIEYVTKTVDASPAPGESPEAAARNARYRELSALVEEGDGLLTAHHQDDQAETVILQLLRGAGVAGLAAMPTYTSFSRGVIARPFLTFSRQSIQHYAMKYELFWVDDPSNFDTAFDRNYLRHNIMPRLGERWPAVVTVLARVAQHQAEAARLIDVLAKIDYAQIHNAEADTLQINKLVELELMRQRNVLRYWIKTAGFPLPSTKQLRGLQHEVLTAGEDRVPCLSWSGAEVRRYQNHLFIMPSMSDPDLSWESSWSMQDPLSLPNGLGCLTLQQVIGKGIRKSLCDAGKVIVRFRQGGERLQLAGRHHTHALKKILQEQGVSPWQRQRIPLIYVDGELAAVVGICIAHGFDASGEEPGLEVHLDMLGRYS